MGITFTDATNRAALSRAVKAGRLRRIAQGVYTDDLSTPEAEVVARYRWEIIAHFIPDAVIVDRSAAAGGAPQENVLYVASESRTTDFKLPGLEVAVRQGPRIASDMPWGGGLRIASPARTLVDNLAISRGRGRKARTLTIIELGDWVARQAVIHGPERLNRISDEAKTIADELDVGDRGEQIDELVSAALGTGDAPGGPGPFRALSALAGGRGFDQERVAAFDEASAHLADRAFDPEVPEALADEDLAGSSLGFWEAYFSNYIEGTIFGVEEAREIVDSGIPPVNRPADGHDILGTYRVVTDPDIRARVAHDPGQLLDLVKALNAQILAGRPEMRPGEIKNQANQASGYRFVEPALVEATLAEGFRFRDRISNPFARAAFMFFLVSEVHPFSDGNGRVARAVMNAELTAAGQCRIVIPIVWRNEYLTAVRELSRNRRVGLYMRTLAFAWRWTAAMNWSDPPTTEVLLDQTNALVDSTEAPSRGRRLLQPREQFTAPHQSDR